VIGAKIGRGGPAMVFGRGENPINFVSTVDVAAVVAAVVGDPAYAQQTIEVGGPDNLTLNEFARALLARRGTPGGGGRIQRIPRPMLRLMAATAGPVSPAFARQAAAAIAMDTTDMAFNSTTLRARFPTIAWHTLPDVLDHPMRAAGG
jgi:NADH dehydrogenase